MVKISWVDSDAEVLERGKKTGVSQTQHNGENDSFWAVTHEWLLCDINMFGDIIRNIGRENNSENKIVTTCWQLDFHVLTDKQTG